MKRAIYLFLLFFLLLPCTASAYDFKSGSIYYNITSAEEKTCEVTYVSIIFNYGYSGDIAIPESVDYNGTTYSVTSIWSYAFYGCSSLTSVDIPNSVTSIGSSVFSGCTGLTSVDIPSSVTSIGSYAFDDCTALTDVTLGTSLESIGEEAFSGCTAMTSLTCYAVMPPVCDTDALADIIKWKCDLYVPEKGLERYKVADQWKDFYFINGIATGIESPVTDAAGGDLESVLAGPFEVYNLSGQCVARSAGASSLGEALSGLARGVYVLTGNGATYKALKQ